MLLWFLSYTARGRDTAARIAKSLAEEGCRCRRFALPRFCKCGDEPLTSGASQWAESAFAEADGVIFCCAAGIAVRAIAPFVKSKTTDPAVLVTDEYGRFIIPLLSGHLGGANALANRIAEKTGGTAVITTATDLNGTFAVDVFAAKNHLYIEEMHLAKEISAALLEGRTVGFRSDLPWRGALPEGLAEELTDGLAEGETADFRSDLPRRGALPEGLAEGEAGIGLSISADLSKQPFPKTLHLIPRRFAAGIGCRRGKTEEELETFLLEQLSACGVSVKELRCVASIDLKAEEPGLVALCKMHGLPFRTFAAEELLAVPGEFTGSDFVRERTGVDSVCERAAVLASGGHLTRKKSARDGMTFALAAYEEVISFS